MGFLLYLLKRFHILPNIILFPLFIVVPIVVFYFSMGIAGHNVQYMREEGWMFAEKRRGLFYEQYIYLDLRKVNVDALLGCIPSLLILVLVITLDAFLKLSSTKKKLGTTSMDIVHELRVAGYQNIISALCVGTAGYSLVKLNILNYSITNDVSERRATIFVGLLCGLV